MSCFVNQNRESMREAWRAAWRRCREALPLEPLQVQIAEVIAAHPEYQAYIASEAALASDFAPQDGRENPFLHMGLHLALQEQISTDRPTGIAAVHRRLATMTGSAHAAEHRMIEVLAVVLWDAQRSGRPPDEARYLEQLVRL
jgi:hypothetical protein